MQRMMRRVSGEPGLASTEDVTCPVSRWQCSLSRGTKSWTYFFSPPPPSVFRHDKNNKSRDVGRIIDACSFSLQIYLSIMTQIKRLSLNQNVNERNAPRWQPPVAFSGPVLQGPLILKERLQLPVMTGKMIMAGSEEG